MKYFVLLFALLCFAACENELEEVEQFMEKKDVTIETAKEVEILYSDSAKVRVKITAPVLYFHRDPKNPHKEFPNGVAVDFFGSNFEVTSRLTAKKAFQYDRKYQVEVQDSVVLVGSSNDTLFTEQLIWDERKEKITSNKFVRISQPDEIIYGYGFESNQDLTNYRIFSVTGRMRVEEFVEGLE